MFFVHAMDDDLPAEHSILMSLALKRAGIATEMHIYGGGGHGFGLRDTGSASATWPDHCEAWLHTIDVLEPVTSSEEPD
jgi:dipeptidyl aminopeptidase/acylaminoacyl peptidase